MSVRNRLRDLVDGPASRVVEPSVRQVVEEILATRSYVRPGELQALRQRVEQLEAAEGGTAGPDPRVDELETRIQKLEKKLNMAMGAIQAATAQLADTRRVADEAHASAGHATQQATSAQATAEAAADGVTGVEEAVAALMERIADLGKGSTTAPAPAAAPNRGAKKGHQSCQAPGCSNKPRRRGLCERHYNQWKAGELDIELA